LASKTPQRKRLYSPNLRQNGWTQITPGGETLCGHGAPYSFFYREGESEKLLIDFQGGGMCWNGQTCNVSTTTFDDWINPSDGSDNPGVGTVGIMDLSHPENPFGLYDMLFVSYCNGDMHTGNHEQGYTYNDTYFDTKHKGAVNASAALNWLYANKPAPESVFVTGCSAGAVGAAFWTADIANHYGGNRTTLFADSGGGWRGIPGDTWTAWGTNYQGVTGGSLSVQRFFTGSARAGAKSLSSTHIADGTCKAVHHIASSGAPYVDALRANLARFPLARAASATSRARRHHSFIPRGDFYSYFSNAVRIPRLVARSPTINRRYGHCTSCVG